MNRASIVLVAALLLAVPVTGRVQQVPGEGVKTPPATIADLQNLIKAQTEAIQALHTQVVDLEARVAKLEKTKPTVDSH